jgi:siroheme synthase (precorrin-2 oxidase/ferrochelatase)
MEMFSDDDSNYNLQEDENVRLLMSGCSPLKTSSLFEKYKKSSETVFDVRNPFDDENLKNDTDFVVNAINDSHESLLKLVSK